MEREKEGVGGREREREGEEEGEGEKGERGVVQKCAQEIRFTCLLPANCVCIKPSVVLNAFGYRAENFPDHSFCIRVLNLALR